MSKGSNRRKRDPEFCSEKQFEDNWDKIFGTKSDTDGQSKSKQEKDEEKPI